MGQICCDCCRADIELQRIFKRARKEVLKRSKLLMAAGYHEDAQVHRDAQNILYDALGAEFSRYMDEEKWKEHAKGNLDG